MSASTAFPLRYVLPTTVLTINATLRLAVVVDDRGGHLEPEVAVSLSAPWHPHPLVSVRRVPTPDAVAPSSTPALFRPGGLRQAFDRAHPRTAALIADLSARSEQYLAGLRMGEEPGQVVTFGQALEVVHRELAAVDRTRREWISRQGKDLRVAEWDLSGNDMVAVPGARGTLPADLDLPEGRARDLAGAFGLLLVLVTDTASAPTRVRTTSAGIAVYRRRPQTASTDVAATDPVDPSAPGGSDEDWVRDDVLSRLWLADAEQSTDLPHQRTSPEVERLMAPFRGQAPGSDPQLEAATRAARTQLDLLDASDEYSRIAATQYRADEIAALQHQMRLAFMPRQRSGD